MKSFDIKYLFFKLIKTFPVTALNDVDARKEFKERKGDYPIFKVLRNAG